MTGALLEGLEAAARGLEAGDLPGAAAAMDRAEEATAALRAAGVRLSGAELELARALQARCLQAALPAQERLHAELRQAGRGNRAVSAYGR